MNLDYCILATGSSGNAVRIENVMVDCGIPFKKMKDELYKCNVLLITHRHSDHLKPSTFWEIRRQFPRIKVIANADIAYDWPVDKVIGSKPFELKGIKFYPFEGKHDVPVTGYVMDFDGTKVFYATDTCEVKNPTDDKIDYCFIECNYDERKLNEIGKQYARKGYDPFAGAYRHLSVQQAKAFYYGNRRNKDSPMIELHQSKRFR